MTSDHAFGTNDLTPELLRSATFHEQDGRYDAAEVRTFLDRVASSLEVFLSADARTALQSEFARNAEIAKQVLDAGQDAAEQLRRQAAEEAKRILDEARDATLGLRQTVDAEIEQARSQVEAMRGSFIQDLRDLYDRIGASLYRFERAADESSTAPIREPEPAPAPAPATASVPAPVHEPAPEPVAAPEPEDEIKPPAWQQLPPEAWTGGASEPQPATEPAPASGPAPEPGPEGADDPFAVVEDEPLAPGEPLVDLRELGMGDAPAEVPPLAPQAAAAPEPLPSESGGSWLDEPVEEAAPEPEPVDVARDDALAEAIIAGTEPAGANPSPIPAPILGEADSEPAPAVDASPDSLEIRRTILELSAAGHTREAIAAYLSDQLHLREPHAMVDAALGGG